MLYREIKPQTVLIVDDEPANISLLNEVLKTDYRIMVAKDGKRALLVAQSNPPPDLILLDIVMPELDGYEVLKRLKADEDTKKIPIIFVTSKNKDEDETKGLEMGAVDYIHKPFNPAVVKARVKAHLELKQNRDFLEWMLKEKTEELKKMEKEYSYLFLRK
ncbi:MAG TPA: response regulator [Smithellaceae bacterium]|jgi:PleD family two-component response regulator|nr:response regulator [Syntrophaceae bacterium]HPL96446.1 response regulator [Smithellaceae bacterium]HPV49480.1 response regulator [Smithellaceae bacterium]